MCTRWTTRCGTTRTCGSPARSCNTCRRTAGRGNDDPDGTPSDHPDFFARFADAYDAELGAFLQHLAEKTPFRVGAEVGWKTLLVANLAEASSRRGGHVYHLETEDGRAVTGLEQAER